MSRRTKKILAVFLIADAILVTSWVFSYRALLASADRAGGLAQEIFERQEKEKGLNFMQQIVEETAEQRAVLSNYFISQNEEVNYLEEVERWAKQADVRPTINSADIKGDVLALNYTVRGSFADIFYFINLQEASPFKIDVQKLNLEKREAGWEANFTVNLLSFIKSDD